MGLSFDDNNRKDKIFAPFTPYPSNSLNRSFTTRPYADLGPSHLSLDAECNLLLGFTGTRGGTPLGRVQRRKISGSGMVQGPFTETKTQGGGGSYGLGSRFLTPSDGRESVGETNPSTLHHGSPRSTRRRMGSPTHHPFVLRPRVRLRTTEEVWGGSDWGRVSSFRDALRA